MKTILIREDLEQAAALLRNGGLVGVPTETVYGLAGNGLDEAAVRRIYEVKGRPEVKPLALMVSGAEEMERYCEDVPQAAKALAERFWPGPLSIVLKARTDVVPEIVRAGGETVSLRCPDHAMTLQALKLAGIPFAAPSANPSGSPSPKTADEVLSYFNGQIDAVIDGGPCGLGRESTILDMSRVPYRILRQGALAAEEIRAALAENLRVIGITGPSGAGKTTALSLLREKGAFVLDCDAVYHELLERDATLLGAIEQAFPGTVKDGALDRKTLGTVVFSDPDALETLNGITHRFVSVAVLARGFQTARQLVKLGHLVLCQLSEVPVFQLVCLVNNLCHLVLDFRLGVGTDIHSLNLSEIRKKIPELIHNRHSSHSFVSTFLWFWCSCSSGSSTSSPGSSAFRLLIVI